MGGQLNYKKFKKKIIIYMILFILAAVLLETVILHILNKRNIDKTSKIMLDQVENILNENDQSARDLLEGLKSEYIDRAKSVAYILGKNREVENDSEELSHIAKMMNIDEIHLFDKDGMIFGGTHPNYYGMTFDSGEQMAYFKPMLGAYDMVMCQDVTPNTADSRSMMYAIAWNDDGSYMVQVGIEPVRLLDEMKENSIYEAINRIPIYEGMKVYVAQAETGEILGTTDKVLLGANIYDKELLDRDDDLQSEDSKTIHLDGFRNYCYCRLNGDNVIVVVHSTSANVSGFIVSIIIEIVGLLLAGSIIVSTLLKLANANRKVNDQMNMLTSISDIYYSMHLIDMDDYSLEKIHGNSLMDMVMNEGQNATDMLETIVKKSIVDEYKEASLDFVNLATLNDRFGDRKFISMDTIDKNVGWLRMTFITVETKEDGTPLKVIVATQIIDDDKKREEELSIKANRDELTGLLNRRAYEDDILNLPDIPPEQDFVYAAIDINGLKVINDELGHAAGDEIIQGAAECLKKTLGNYGKVYRVGGDEFVAIFFADETQLQAVMEDLEKRIISWEGKIVKSLSLSSGFVSKREFGNETIVNMAKAADERMYKAKSAYYSRKGVDRRGQAAAHTALCNLYTKILKVNLTEDSYSIVNMDDTEQTTEKGFSDSISQWLYGFGKSGQVHADDLEDYLKMTDIEFLRDYFKQDKTSISIFYRRKYADGYKQAVMEMIPADDYDDNNQSLFLYVKSIDK